MFVQAVTSSRTYSWVNQYLLPLIAAFHGRAINTPKEPMSDREESDGGWQPEVEHEVSPIRSPSALI